MWIEWKSGKHRTGTHDSTFLSKTNIKANHRARTNKEFESGTIPYWKGWLSMPRAGSEGRTRWYSWRIRRNWWTDYLNEDKVVLFCFVFCLLCCVSKGQRFKRAFYQTESTWRWRDSGGVLSHDQSWPWAEDVLGNDNREQSRQACWIKGHHWVMWPQCFLNFHMHINQQESC